MTMAEILPTKEEKLREPLGEHPVGAGLGALGGGVAAGAAIGTVAGPVGTALGAAAGAMAGGIAGQTIAETVDPTAEEAHWRENFHTRPYAIKSNVASFDEYAPAYRYGITSYQRYPGRSLDEIESDLGRDWDAVRGESSLTWDHAKHAVQDAWHRVRDAFERAMPGDSDRDGR
jgi:hypothetical protein